MAKKQMTFQMLHAVFGEDKNMPVAVTVTSKGVIAKRDGVELKADTIDPTFVPDTGIWMITIVSDKVQDAVVTKAAAAAPVKQSPMFDSY